MIFSQPSLRLRIFLAMIILIITASILIAAVTIFQYSEESKDYHKERLERKEQNIKRHIKGVIDKTSFEVIPEKFPFIFRDEIFTIANIHNLQINLYDLEGNLLKSSKAVIEKDSLIQCVDAEVLNKLAHTANHRHVEQNFKNGEVFRSSYSYITDRKFKNIAILNLPYLENDDFLQRELNEFLWRLGLAYLFMLFIAVIIAYFTSKYITKSLKTISDVLQKTRLESRNKKIEIQDASVEIKTVVNAYNSMIDELEESAVKLATNEREHAWREMAKQVAHEIKNPLTPMRLSVQSFLRNFNPKDPHIDQKINEYSHTLIQQIDTMSSIASAFSNFAKMPAQKTETLDVVKIVKLALDIFNEPYISFINEEDQIIAEFDRTQLIRVINNLVKNSIQSLSDNLENPKIEVKVTQLVNEVEIRVSDNGIGIAEENKSKVFEPKFTTKTSGMGLGLPMIKKIIETYQGSINFVSELKKGTTFIVKFPKK